MDTWELITLPLSGIVVLLHFYGIYMLWRVRELSSSKYVLIASFSFSNIAFAFHNLIRFPIHDNFPVVYTYLSLIVEGLRIPFYGTMVLLTSERFLEVYLHMRYYNSCFNKHKLMLALSLWLMFVIWSIGSTTALALKVPMNSIAVWISINFSLAAHFVIIIQFLIVYAYVYKKMREHKKSTLLTTQNCQPTTTVASRRRVFIPFFIVLTFIIFDTVPDLFIIFAGMAYSSWILLLFRLDTFFNAVIYLFLQPRIKKRLSRRFRESKIVKLQLQDLSVSFTNTVSKATPRIIHKVYQNDTLTIERKPVT